MSDYRMKEFIERNKLLEEIEYFISHTDDEDPEHYAYKTCKRLIENMSTADVVEVKRGRWKPVHHNGKLTGGKCSVCGKFKRTDNMGTLYNGYKVCHRCGAKMGKA